jgi:aryl-alcohol dehydrogenase-like predicted oxidoreductase
VRYLAVDTPKKISKIGLGTWQFGSKEWGYGELYDEQLAHTIVRRAVELGVTLFDTAEIYSSGRSERILGQALGEDRESVVLATKIWPVVPSASWVKRRAIASAHRLGVSRLDLYQTHWPSPLVRDSTIMGGMRSLQETGLVGEVGVSSYSLERWRAAENMLRSRVLSNQVAYSLVERSAEQELIPFAESHGRIIIAFSPLAQGLLSGKYHGASRPTNQVRAASPLFHPANLERTSDLIAVLREVADAHDATPAQVALASVIRRSAVAAIPGASSVEQLESNVAAAEIDLTDDEYQALTKASARFRPTAVKDAPRHRPPSAVRRNLASLKHLSKGGVLLTQTARHDYKLRHISSGDTRNKE